MVFYLVAKCNKLCIRANAMVVRLMCISASAREKSSIMRGEDSLRSEGEVN